MPLQIWVDADACPNVIKDILFKAAERKKTPPYPGRQSDHRNPTFPLY